MGHGDLKRSMRLYDYELGWDSKLRSAKPKVPCREADALGARPLRRESALDRSARACAFSAWQKGKIRMEKGQRGLMGSR